MKLRIAHFTDSYKPYNSGVVHSISVLKEELSRLGHDVMIFAPSYPHVPEEENTFRFYSLPAPTNPDYNLAVPYSRHLSKTIKRMKPHVIHVHHPFSLGWVGMRYARRLGLPLVYTCHTLYEYYSHYLPLPPKLAQYIIKKLCLDFCNRCDVIITPTVATRNYLRKLGVKTHMEVIPTGIDARIFSPRDPRWLRNRYNIKPGEKVLLFVGRMGQEKNATFILKSFARLYRALPHTRLVMVGEGPQKRELKKMARDLGVGDKVTFTGLLPQNEVVKCYHGADIFVFASLSETQGLVVPEAKTAGLPVVALKANGVSEMVEDGVDGFLTEPSVEEFTAKVKLLLENEVLRKEMAQRAVKNAEKLSSPTFALNILEVYFSLQANTSTLSPFPQDVSPA